MRIANRYLVFKLTRNRHMKVLCHFGLFFRKPNVKTKAEWVVFLKFEYICAYVWHNWELPTVILFLNKQEIDIWKSFVASASSLENQMRKQRQSWVVFLKFEYIWMGKCDKMQTIFSSFEIEQNKHRGVHCISEGCCC